MSDMYRKLRKEFKSKEYAHGYMESFCVDRIASQIHTLRKQRNLSQEELSVLSGIAQERISKLESGDFSSITMKTLNKLSRAFDVNLVIKFESFSQAISDVIGLSEHFLQVASRSEDLAKPYLVHLRTTGHSNASTMGEISITRESGRGIRQYVSLLKEKDKIMPHIYAGVESSEIDNRLRA